MLKAYRLFSEEKAKEIVDRIKQEEWKTGLAAKRSLTGTIKRNLEIQSKDSPYATEILEEIRKTIKDSPATRELLLSNILTPKFNWYKDTGEYKIHSDASLMGNGVRTDYAMTLFLTDEFEGGELCIGGSVIKAKPGVAVVYDCWRPHWVNPVTKGDRIAAITWAQSYIPDETQIELLQILYEVTAEIGKTSNQEHFAKLGAVHEKLVKMWMK